MFFKVVTGQGKVESKRYHTLKEANKVMKERHANSTPAHVEEYDSFGELIRKHY